MPDHKLTKRAAWRIEFPEHTVGGRIDIPATVLIQYEQTKRAALTIAVLTLHVRHEVPGWKPWMRDSARLAQIERTVA